jgi:hypothetical protein
MSLTPYERETIISYSDGDDRAHVYTEQRTVINRLKKLSGVILEGEGERCGSPWARFRLPASYVKFRAPRRLSDTHRAQLAGNLARARAARGQT